jgi:formate hydrogenlyase transcriptional activator
MSRALARFVDTPPGGPAPADRRATLQAVVADAATRCVNAAADGIDAAVAAVLAEIGQVLTLEHCVAYLPDDTDDVRLSAAYTWFRSGTRPPDDLDALAALPWIVSRVREGEPIAAATLDALPDPIDREAMRSIGARSCAAVPIGPAHRRGVLLVDASRELPWPSDVIDSLRLAAAVMGQALARKPAREPLASSLDELPVPPDRPGDEPPVLRRETFAVRSDRTIASDSAAIQRVLAQVHQVAPTSATVLLLGETGVGKELFAQTIHNLSPRQRRQMIRVSCAAIPTALIESELFGRERGAFTGALSRQIGRFEAANGSTIFLDEIGDLPIEVQVKLLRVLQERTVERLGGNQSMKVDVRVIAATNRNLEEGVEKGTFREDLFYRLDVFRITIPALRERTSDIPALVWTFVDEFSRAFGKPIDAISKESLAALQRYPWPGNVRELRNVIEREMIVATGPTLHIAAPRPLPSHRQTPSTRLVDVEAEHIRAVLDSCGWRVRGAGGAAELLDVKPTTLESRMARLGVRRERKLSSR